jgi:nitrate reductase NapE component
LFAATAGPSIGAILPLFRLVPPMRKRSETLLLLPLLPIFLVGMFPMLLIGMLGSAGLVIFGILLIRVGLAGNMEAHGDFNREVIVHGYARGPERGAQASDLKAAMRMSMLLHVSGLAMITAGIAGLFLVG